MTFDLPAILAEIKEEPTWHSSKRNAVTLLKQPGWRVVLIALQAGTEIASHRTNSAVSLHALEGLLMVQVVGEKTFTLAAGQLVTVSPGLEHALQAPVESAFLLTIAGDATHPAENE